VRECCCTALTDTRTTRSHGCLALQYGQSLPLPVPQLGSCASLGRAWRHLVAWYNSQGEAQPLGAPPLPLVLERSASKAADSTAFDHPGTDRAEISASVIFASQRIPEAKNTIPTFGCNNGGVIFRPGVTRVLCGAPGDCGGTCHTFCDAPSGGSRSSQRDQFPGDDCRFNGQPATGLHAWRTTNIGSFLRRVAEFQQAAKRSFYNEIVVDPKLWRSRPERAVEAIFVDGTPNGFGEEPEVNEEVASLHRQFLAEFGLSAELNPLLLLDRSNWDSPFRNLSSAAVRR
jgi:hypothetical protein